MSTRVHDQYELMSRDGLAHAGWVTRSCQRILYELHLRTQVMCRQFVSSPTCASWPSSTYRRRSYTLRECCHVSLTAGSLPLSNHRALSPIGLARLAIMRLLPFFLEAFSAIFRCDLSQGRKVTGVKSSVFPRLYDFPLYCWSFADTSDDTHAASTPLPCCVNSIGCTKGNVRQERFTPNESHRRTLRQLISCIHDVQLVPSCCGTHHGACCCTDLYICATS